MAHKSNALFHFTKESDTLIKILETGFIPFYCKEEIDDLFGDESYLFNEERALDIGLNTFPLVSFCDIPLTSIEQHVKKYGKYAIGMSQTWGLNNGLTPVVYYHEKMPTYKDIKELYESLHRRKSNEFKTDPINSSVIYSTSQAIRYLKHQKCYFKPMYIKNKSNNPIYFHLENEWRYVPNIKQYEDRLNYKFFILSDEKNDLNQEFKKKQHHPFSLKFHIDDIEYIIVPTKDEIRKLIIKIKKWASGRKYNNETVDFLLSKIISLTQIRSDF